MKAYSSITKFVNCCDSISFLFLKHRSIFALPLILQKDTVNVPLFLTDDT